MKTLMINPPPLGHPDRAEWNRRLDEALTGGAEAVAAMALQARNEASRRGDTKAAVAAAEVARRARKVMQAARGPR